MVQMRPVLCVAPGAHTWLQPPTVQPQGDARPAASSCQWLWPLGTEGRRPVPSLVAPSSGNHRPGICLPLFPFFWNSESHCFLIPVAAPMSPSGLSPCEEPRRQCLLSPKVSQAGASAGGSGKRCAGEEGGRFTHQLRKNWKRAPGPSFPGSLPARPSLGLSPGLGPSRRRQARRASLLPFPAAVCAVKQSLTLCKNRALFFSGSNTQSRW